jgi:hypothetical protein
MALETVVPDPGGITTLASMLFPDHVRFQVISELPPNHLRICGLWHSRAGRKSPLRTFGSGSRGGFSFVHLVIFEIVLIVKVFVVGIRRTWRLDLSFRFKSERVALSVALMLAYTVSRYSQI